MMVLRYILGHRAAVEPHQHTQWNRGLGIEASARHIFTGNAPSLQVGATELFDSIQIGCPLLREGDDSSYFSHTAVLEPDAQWPACLTRAREVIAKSIKTYVFTENQEMDIQRLLVKGWVDSGSRWV
jgi:hypothetical protein